MDWKSRALKAEEALRQIAAIPNDSWGWRLLRQETAKEYFMEQKPFIILRPAPEKEWAAEICVRGHDDVYRTILMNDRALLVLAKQASNLVTSRGYDLIRQLEIFAQENLDTQHQSQHQQSIGKSLSVGELEG